VATGLRLHQRKTVLSTALAALRVVLRSGLRQPAACAAHDIVLSTKNFGCEGALPKLVRALSNKREKILGAHHRKEVRFIILERD
jgi:hypothetical protein